MLIPPTQHRGLGESGVSGVRPGRSDGTRGVRMARRFLSLAATVAVTLGVGVVAATGASAAAPVNAHGSMHCTVTGTVKFKPGLVNGGTASSVAASMKLKSTSCSGTAHVTSLKGTLAATLTSNNCIDLATKPFPASNTTVKYKSATKYNASTIHYTTGAFTPTNPITFDEPGSGSSSVAGSFVGQHPTIHLQLDQDVNALAAACAGKGLKKMSFSTNSNIDIPA